MSFSFSRSDFFATLSAFGIAIGWVSFLTYLVNKKYISTNISRKLTHIGTGPLFILTWSFFTNLPNARYWAALVPFALTLKFFLVGINVIHDPETVQLMSRSGQSHELLYGPFIYGLIFISSTIFFWRNSIIGLIALILLCVGDGMADLIGRHYGTNYPIFYNKRKSYIGSLTFLISSYIINWYFIQYFYQSQWIVYSVDQVAWPLFWITLIATVIESLPILAFDNLTVFVSSIISCYLLLPTK